MSTDKLRMGLSLLAGAAIGAALTGLLQRIRPRGRPVEDADQESHGY